MGGFLSNAGLWIDALGGAAQVALALYVFARARSGRDADAFALFFGANGFAFLLRNLIPHGHALFPLLGLTVWGVLNWVASAALLILSLRWLADAWRARLPALYAAASVGLVLGVLSWAAAPPSVTLVAFGGAAVYSAVAYVLVLALLSSAGDDEARITEAAFFTAVLGVNSALHAGVSVVGGGSVYNFAHAAVLLFLAVAWLLRVRGARGWRPAAALASALTGAGLCVGAAAAAALGSVAAVQDSGIYGVGRMLSAAVAAYALNRKRMF